MGDLENHSTRQELHSLLECIPEEDVPTVRQYLRSFVDPVMRSILNAPEDDEEQSPEEREHVERARRGTGPDTPHEDVLKEFGL